MPGRRLPDRSSTNSYFCSNRNVGENYSIQLSTLPHCSSWRTKQSQMTEFPKLVPSGLAIPSLNPNSPDPNSISSISASSVSSFGGMEEDSPSRSVAHQSPPLRQQPSRLAFSSPLAAQPTPLPLTLVLSNSSAVENFLRGNNENGLISPTSVGELEEHEVAEAGGPTGSRRQMVRCELCSISCRTPGSLIDHFKGKAHTRRLRYFRKRSVVIKGVPSPIPKDQLETFFGGLQIDFNAALSFLAPTLEESTEEAEGPVQYVSFGTQADAERAIRLTGRSINGFPVQISSAYKPMECFICEITFNSVAQTEQHIHSRKHRRRLEWYISESTVTVKGLTPLIREVDIHEFFKIYEILPEGIVISLNPKQPPFSLFASHTDTSAAICDSVEAMLRGIDDFEVECRVTFESPTEAQRAVREKNGRPLLGEDGYGGPVELQIVKVAKSSNGSESD